MTESPSSPEVELRRACLRFLRMNKSNFRTALTQLSDIAQGAMREVTGELLEEGYDDDDYIE